MSILRGTCSCRHCCGLDAGSRRGTDVVAERHFSKAPQKGGELGDFAWQKEIAFSSHPCHPKPRQLHKSQRSYFL